MGDNTCFYCIHHAMLFRGLASGRSLEALEGPLALELGDDVHALQSYLPRSPLEDRLPIDVHLSKRSSQRFRRLCFSPETSEMRERAELGTASTSIIPEGYGTDPLHDGEVETRGGVCLVYGVCVIFKKKLGV